MPHTITMSTDAQVVNKTGDTLQLIMVWSSIQAGSGDTPYVAKAVGVRVADWGKVSWKYDVDDALLVPGTYSVKLFESLTFLRNIMYDFTTTFDGGHYSVRAEVTVKLNGVVEYIGKIQEDSLDYSVSEQSLSFTCDPDIDVLNKTLLFDEYSDPINNPLDPLGYGMQLQRFTKVIQDCYRLVNPDITENTSSLQVIHDWTFYGGLVPYIPMNDPVDDFVIGQLVISTQELFYEVDRGLVSIGDVLRKLAVDWCAFTGMIHKEKAFFKKLFSFDSSNTQTLGRVLDRNFTYRYSLLDFVYIHYTYLDAIKKYTRGTDTHIADRTLDRDILPCFGRDDDWVGGVNPTIPVYTNVYAKIHPDDGLELQYGIVGVKDPVLLSSNWSNNGDLIAEFWFNFRGSIEKCRVDELVVEGITYDFLKDFVDQGRRYQTLEMEKDFANNVTTFGSIYLGLDVS